MTITRHWAFVRMSLIASVWCLAFIMVGHAHAQVPVADSAAAQELARAETLIEIGDYDEAVDILKRLSEEGFVLAAVRLADLLYDEVEIGASLPDTPEQREILDLAIEFYRQATTIDGRHFDRAGRRLARLLLLRAETEEDVNAAVDQLRGLIVLGSGAAAYDLGRAYIFARGVSGDARQAEQYLHIAIEMGEFNAARLFGFVLARGIGRPPDPVEAIRYLTMAVEHDDYRAARTMADVYARTLGDSQGAIAAVEAEIEILLRLYRDDPRPAFAMRLSELYLRDPYRPQDLGAGMDWLLRAASDDTGLAAYRLFQIYADDDFGAHDPARAQEFAEQVAGAEYWDAMPTIADHYMSDACASPVQAATVLDWLEQAAEAGHPNSMFMLSRALAGRWPCINGGQRDARRWLLAAAQSGWGNNEDVLDMAREILESANDNSSQADGLALLEVAAVRGNLAAKTDLGAILVAAGQPVSQVRRGAEILRTVANEENGARAMLTLARTFLYSADLAEREEALAWLKRAAGYGRPDALRILGRVHLEGMVTPYDLEAAITVLSRALAYGDGESGLMLADVYLAGINGAVDLERARSVLERAAEFGSTEAMVRLSEIYQLGLGVEPQPAIAEELLTRAAAAGNVQARDLLETMLQAFPPITSQPAG